MPLYNLTHLEQKQPNKNKPIPSMGLVRYIYRSMNGCLFIGFHGSVNIPFGAWGWYGKKTTQQKQTHTIHRTLQTLHTLHNLTHLEKKQPNKNKPRPRLTFTTFTVDFTFTFGHQLQKVGLAELDLAQFTQIPWRSKKRSFFSKTAFLTYFLGSMYGIFTYNLVAFFWVNVGKYTIHGSWILW